MSTPSPAEPPSRPQRPPKGPLRDGPEGAPDEPAEGPPEGPLTPRDGASDEGAGPEREHPADPAGASRNRRRLVLAVAAGVLVVAGVVLAVVLTGGGGGEAHTPESAAHEVPLQVDDWGGGYQRAEPYTDEELTELQLTPDCLILAPKARPGTRASFSRRVWVDGTRRTRFSAARVFEDEATARGFMEDYLATLDSCPERHFGQARWTGVHAAPVPKVTGFDQVLAEEGVQTVGATGGPLALPYVSVYGRDGDTVLSVFAQGDRGDADALRTLAGEKLQDLQKRLAAARKGQAAGVGAPGAGASG
ncbi:hypothetical protein [Streptomyces sp. NPDC090025]|uniref:hypothetical protein n=1 Tax=Streptomyces sp. NPDC090025 TaxID=3365922 RepID=UPI003832446E